MVTEIFSLSAAVSGGTARPSRLTAANAVRIVEFPGKW